MYGPTQTLLLTESEDARVHCAVLNVRPDTGHPPPPDPRTPTGDTAVRGTDRPRQEINAHPRGPPGMARSLRTQQRAYNPVLRAIRVPHATPSRRTQVTPYW